MSIRDKITAKGIYKHPQAEDFISVKQYMFVYRDGVKYLVLRCSNDTETALTSMKFVLTELDSDGAVLDTRKITYKDINADAGATFAPSRGIPVSDECVDFKIRFVRAVADKYVYKASGKRAYAYYAPKKILGRRLSMSSVGFSTSSFGLSGFGLIAGLMATATVLLIAILTLTSIF